MSVSDQVELKGLQVHLTRLLAERDEANRQAREALKEANACQTKIDVIERQIRKIQEETKDPIVSEHALLRYVERVLGIDLEAIKRSILSEKVRGYIKQLPSGKFPGDGFRVVVKNRTVTTITTKDDHKE